MIITGEYDRFSQLTTAAGFKSLPPMRAQRNSQGMVVEVDSLIQSPWGVDLGPLHPLAPIDVATDRRGTTPVLIFPSMDPLVTQTLNEGGEVKVSPLESS
jgi:hypothetical protein